MSSDCSTLSENIGQVGNWGGAVFCSYCVLKLAAESPGIALLLTHPLFYHTLSSHNTSH